VKRFKKKRVPGGPLAGSGAKRTLSESSVPRANLTKRTVNVTIHEETNENEAVCTARTTVRTGVEREALTGVKGALLTIYDMCKAAEKSMEMSHIYLEHKSGGKSGEFYNEVRRQR